ncbi:MAG: hypothetical protein J3Q66DRAFT_64104 [Benniella sp.]|nr:MAG: hypothetical protein J3Q66DRAFT_64104 [Benniella sp.]
MPSQHPLELPEILSHIALYLHSRSYPTCAQVSKGWYQVFIPLIWKSVHLRAGEPHPEAVLRYSHHVATLYVHLEDQVLDPLRCPNLQSLTLAKYPTSKELILSHTHITRLCLQHAQLVPELWTTLLQLHSLRDLELYGARVLEQDTDAFWQLCTRLKRLSVFYLSIPRQGQLSSMEFPRLKEMDVGKVNDIPTILGFMSRCQNLAVIRWHGAAYRQDSYDLVERIASNTWPSLHSVSIPRAKVSDDDLASILRGMQQITSLDMSCSSTPQPGTMDLLRQHFSNLATLDMDFNIWPSPNPIAQEILSSCPLLERCVIHHIDATAIAKGKPWVCSRLRTLFMDLQFDPLTISDIQPRVFEQIARLCRLEYLRLWGGRASASRRVVSFSVDLRLQNGLDKLSTLRSLRVIEFRGSTQKMGKKEIVWMLEHWRSLEMIRGKLNVAEPWVQDKLVRILKGRGVRTVV